MLKKYLLFFIFIFVCQYIYADVPNEIRYNGRLKEYRIEANGTRNINFKIYDALTGGTAKWESGNKSVIVSSGIFTATLSPDTNLVDWRVKDYYLEIEIEGKKMEPREKLTAVPYALHSNTSENIILKDSSEFSVTIGNTKNLIVDSSDGTKSMVGSTEYYMVPKGAIIIWSGSSSAIPDGWALCDGTNGTPDLTGRFILGANSEYAVGTMGGEETHVLTINEMPNHNHTTQWMYYRGGSGDSPTDPINPETGDYYIPTSYVGGDKPHNNMPPYYALCYIMRK